MHDRKVVEDFARADLPVSKTPEQVGDLCPTVRGRVPAPLGRRPSRGKAVVEPVDPFPCRADQGALVLAGKLVDFLRAAPRNADLPVDQASQPRGDRSTRPMNVRWMRKLFGDGP
jgi:hypothetical protein